MPEVDGLDILRYVRNNTLLEGLPVISKYTAPAPLQSHCWTSSSNCHLCGSSLADSISYSRS